jgi:hypothetical protein
MQETNLKLQIESQNEFDSILKAIGMKKMLLSCETITAHFNSHKMAIFDYVFLNVKNDWENFESYYSELRKKLLAGKVIFNGLELLIILSDCPNPTKSSDFVNIELDFGKSVMAAKYFYTNKIKPYKRFELLFDKYKLEFLKMQDGGSKYFRSPILSREIEHIFGIYRVSLLYDSSSFNWDRNMIRGYAVIDMQQDFDYRYRESFLQEVHNFVTTFAGAVYQNSINGYISDAIYDFQSKEVFLMVKEKVAEMLISESAQIKAILDGIIGKDLTVLAGKESEYEDGYFVKSICYGKYDFEFSYERRPKNGNKPQRYCSNPNFMEYVGSNEKETAIKLLQRTCS